jgi:thioredoxin 1
MPCRAVLHIRGRDFDSALASQRPALVAFSASWCGACDEMAPALERFATRRSEDLWVVKVDVDEALAITRRYAIRLVPTLVMFKDGVPIARRRGPMNEAELTDFTVQCLHLVPARFRAAEGGLPWPRFPDASS